MAALRFKFTSLIIFIILIFLILLIFIYTFFDLELIYQTKIKLKDATAPPSYLETVAYNNLVDKYTAVQDTSELPSIVLKSVTQGIDKAVGCAIGPKLLPDGETCSTTCSPLVEGEKFFVLSSTVRNPIYKDNIGLPVGNYCIAAKEAPPSCSNYGYLVSSGSSWTCLSPNLLLFGGESVDKFVFGRPPIPILGETGLMDSKTNKLWTPSLSEAIIPDLSDSKWETYCNGYTLSGFRLTPLGAACIVDPCSENLPYTDNYYDQNTGQCICALGFVKKDYVCVRASAPTETHQPCWSNDTPTILSKTPSFQCQTDAQGYLTTYNNSFEHSLDANKIDRSIMRKKVAEFSSKWW